MPYSKNLKLAYVHVPKTGGTTVEKLIQTLDNGKPVAHPRSKCNWWFQHHYASDIEVAVGADEYPNYYKFATVRDPFTLQLSLFRFYNAHPNFIKKYGNGCTKFADHFDFFTRDVNRPYIPNITNINSELINRPLDRIYAFTEMDQLFEDLNKKCGKSVKLFEVNVTSPTSKDPRTHLAEVVTAYGDRLPRALQVYRDEIIWLKNNCPKAIENVVQLYNINKMPLN